VVAPDPYVALSAGRSLFRLTYLLALVAVVRARTCAGEADVSGDDPAGGVK